MDQTSLFSDASPQHISLDQDSELTLHPGWLSRPQASVLMGELRAQVPWQQPTVQVYGKAHKIPRMQAWFGDEGAVMRYSGSEFRPSPWLPVLVSLKEKVEKSCAHRFNSVLVNLYRDGNDSVGWHADDEFELGERPYIASLSLGEGRVFSLKPKESRLGRSVSPQRILLQHGDLLTMSGCTQENWLHAVLKAPRAQGVRLNLTFRYIVNPS